MTVSTGYLGNHPKSHLQHWSNQLWLRLRVTDRPFSEAGSFSKPFYPVLAIFDSLFSYILHVLSRHHAFCPCLMHGKFLAQMPVLSRRNQAPSGVFLVFNILLGIDWCCQELSCLISRDPKLFQRHILQLFEVVEDYLSM